MKLDPPLGTVLGTFPPGAQPEAVCFSRCAHLDCHQVANYVTCLDLNGAVVGTYAVETLPAGIVFHGGSIWVSNSGSNTISQLDYTNGQLIRTDPVGNSPTGVCFDGNAVWVANKTSNNVLRR